MSSNQNLPPLAWWKARSTWLNALAALAVLLQVFGVDLDAWLVARDLTQAEVAEVIVMVLPYALAAWAWFERRAPNFRLTWWAS
ncbi:hypothetical protein [Tropicimonas sp. IMCC34011]|uniref:hypothetical protein n=1 Tax=Tropicimonas sp. IMCC34011 TaxID=2248759 RepID=UPI000E27AC45|nr:hypothetical protein [Tropicimonas sp. IMCC34011]